ncbi:MAG: cytochrome c [Myxococcaceae bacterium]|nr:cytochrome c [Myxococcaceae bacterium]
MLPALLLLCSSLALADEPLSLPGEKTSVTVSYASSEARGATIFNTWCHHCHGATGDGTGHAAANLLLKPADLTAPGLEARTTPDAIFVAVRDGTNVPGTTMIPWRVVLRDESLRDVAAYTAALAAEGRARREQLRLSERAPATPEPVAAAATPERAVRLGGPAEHGRQLRGAGARRAARTIH